MSTPVRSDQESGAGRRSEILINGGTLIDATGAPARPNPGVLLRGDNIEVVGPGAAGTASNDAERIDATGMTVMPGLIDAHCHATFCDPDTLFSMGPSLRNAVEAGVVAGPRISTGVQALVTAVGGTAGRLIPDGGVIGYAQVVNTLDEAVMWTRRHIK